MSTVDDFRAARRADRMADREADREDRRAAADEARKDAEAARKLAAAGRREAEERRKRARAARAAKWGKVTGWVTADPARAFVRLVQACSIVPALISQVGALTDAKVYLLLAALLATMLEGAAWALVSMGSAAEKAGRPARTYRVGAWVAGGVAAAINLAHGLDTYKTHSWVAVVLALSSLVAVWLTDLQTHAGHRPSRAERRKAVAEQAAARAEQTARESSVAAHRAARKAHQPEVYELMERLLSAAPHGTLSEDAAWRIAWEYVHGVGTPGLTADLLAGRNAARSRVAEQSALPAPVDLLGPGRPEDPFPALTVPLSGTPSDSVYLTAVPEALEAPWRVISGESEIVGGIGKQASQNSSGDAPAKPSRETPAAGKPLAAEDLEKVRGLADLMESAGRRMSTSDVKAILGGGRNEYLVRLRRQVEAERAATEPGEAQR